jgi:hypothetical protein
MEHPAAAKARRVCRPGQADDTVRIDPAFEGLIPPLSGAELAELHQSLDAEGCRDALVVWQGQDLLVDGHNRLRRCREKGYPFEVVEKTFADREAVQAYILTQQLGRRNLSAAAESYLRGKRYLQEKRQGARTDLDPDAGDGDTSVRLGAEFKVGQATVRRDGRFAEAVDAVVANCGRDARNLILSRQTGLTRGGVLRLSKMDPDEQREFLRQLKKSGKRPRKARAKRRDSFTVPARPKALVQALLERLEPREIDEVYRALAEALELRGTKAARGKTRQVSRARGAKAK